MLPTYGGASEIRFSDASAVMLPAKPYLLMRHQCPRARAYRFPAAYSPSTNRLRDHSEYRRRR